MTTVSVITPTYNRASTLPNCIKSVQEQTYQDYEHIIVDDGSTDETKKVVTSIDDDRINYLSLNGNQGANAARNRGIKAANGEFVAFLDSDDQYHPEKLEVCVDKLTALSRDDFAGVFHSMQFVEDEEIINISNVDEGEIDFGVLKHGNPIGGFTDIMFRSDIFDEIGALDEDMPAYQDWEFFLRVLNEYQMWGIAKPLSIKRESIPKGSECRVSDQLESKSHAQDLLLEKHGDKISQKIQSEFHYTRGFLKMERGNTQGARQEFKQAVRLYAKNPLYIYHYIATFGGKQGFEISVNAKKKVKLILSS